MKMWKEMSANVAPRKWKWYWENESRKSSQYRIVQFDHCLFELHPPHNYQPLQGEISEGFQPGAAEENLHSFDSVPEVHLTVLLEWSHLELNFTKHQYQMPRFCRFQNYIWVFRLLGVWDHRGPRTVMIVCEMWRQKYQGTLNIKHQVTLNISPSNKGPFENCIKHQGAQDSTCWYWDCIGPSRGHHHPL